MRNMNKSNRILELDLMKSFIIIVSMIGIHSLYDLTLLNANSNVTAAVLNVLASQFCAPMFMFCMGVTLSFSRNQEPMGYLHRGIILLTIGMVLNVLRYVPLIYSAYKNGETELFSGLAQIFNVDILQFAGMAFILLALLRQLKWNPWIILAFGMGLNVIGTLLDGHHTDSYVINQILGYFYPTPTCCCFPLMNWFIFVAIGNVMGLIYRTMDKGRFFCIATPVGTVATAVYMYMCLVAKTSCTRALQDDWGFYSMHSCDAFFTAFGIAPFMLGVFRLLSKIVPEKWVAVLSHPSRHINQYFCVSWVWIMWIANLFLFVPKATTEAGFWLVWWTVVGLTVVTVVIYDKYLKSCAHAWFGRHPIAWTVSIWVALVAFGAWYFTTVPGPYTMPY